MRSDIMRLTRTLTTLAMAVAATVALSAQHVAIKLATVAPANSSWQKALLDLGNTWSTSTDKRVSLTVYDGGTQGDEASVIRRMRVDQMQASLLMVSGLAAIDDAFNIFGMPF